MIYDFSKNPAMRANDIEGKIMALLMKAKVFKRKKGKFLGFHVISDLLDKRVFDPSIDSPHISKIKELLVEMGFSPDSRIGYHPLPRVYNGLNRVYGPPD